MADQPRKTGNDPCEIERHNLVTLFKLVTSEVIKADGADHEDRKDEEFVLMQQLLTILEHIFLFALKDNEKDFFTLLEQIEEFCPDAAQFSARVRETSHIKTQMGKARAWLRLAMMQKKLADYVNELVDRKEMLREYYDNGAILLEEDSAMLRNTIIELSCIDCHLSIGESADLDGPVGNIDYSLLQQRKASLPGLDIDSTGSVSDDNDLDFNLQNELLEERSEQLTDADTEQESQETSQREYESQQQQIKDLQAENNLYKKENEGLQAELDMIQQEEDTRSRCSYNGADQPPKRAVTTESNSGEKLSEELITTGGGWEMLKADFGEVKNDSSHQIPVTEAPKSAQLVLSESTDSSSDDESVDLGHLSSIQYWSLLNDEPPEPQTANYVFPMVCPFPKSFTKGINQWMRRQPAVSADVSTQIPVRAETSTQRPEQVDVSTQTETQTRTLAVDAFTQTDMQLPNKIFTQTPMRADASTQVTVNAYMPAQTKTPAATGPSHHTTDIQIAADASQRDIQTANNVSPQTETQTITEPTGKTCNDVIPSAEEPFSHPSTSVSELPSAPQPASAPAVSSVVELELKETVLLNDPSKYNKTESINQNFAESSLHRALAERAIPAGSNSGPKSTDDAQNLARVISAHLENPSSGINVDNKIKKGMSLFKEPHSTENHPSVSESEVFHSLPDSDDFDSISSESSVTPVQSCANSERSGTTDDVIVEISGYVEREWKGATSKAGQIRKGYASVMDEHRFKHIARIRGDNYCALRATFASVVLNNVKLNLPLEQTLQRLVSMNDADPSLLRSWRFPESMSDISADKSYAELYERLLFMISKMSILRRMEDPTEERKELCKLLNTGGSDELFVLEGMKVLMMISAYELHKLYTAGQEVPVFTWLMFARDTSETPALFLKNHLNSVGRDSGVEQVEMCLLGYSLGITLQTFRLYQHGEVDFIALYPEGDSPETLVPVIAEDDRHYNTLVKLNT